jgi:ATP-dependent Clp protease ATP-binding subunit ClpC
MSGWEDFTEEAKAAVNFAQQCAEDHQHNLVGPEHLLFGLLVTPNRSACRFLEQLGCLPEAVRRDLEVRFTTGPGRGSQEMELTEESIAAFRWAIAEARDMGDQHIGPGHMLVGLVGQDKDPG